MHFSLQISRKLSNQSLSKTINSKIKTFIQQGHYIKALQLYSRNPIDTTIFTYPCLLKACASLSLLRYGKTIHSTLITTALSSDPFITTSLISMYVKCGSLRDAVHVFDKWSHSEHSLQDVTVWNSMIDGYFHFGFSQEGMAQVFQMQSIGVRPDAYSLCILLGECGGYLGHLEGKQIHGYVVRNIFEGDLFLETALIDAYFSSGRPMDAWHLFKDLEDEKNTVTWNVMIGGFYENGLWENSLQLYLLAKTENVKLMSASFTCTLSACCHGEFSSFGQQVHCDVIKMGFEMDPYVCTSVLIMYSKCKLVEAAEKVFDQVTNKQIELWNAMISAYVGNGNAYDALKLYKQMKLCDVLPDPFTMSNIISLNSMIGLYDIGRLIHAELVKRPIQGSIAVQSALLTLYFKCGNTDDANSVFTAMTERDVVAWGSMISGFCQNGKYNEALGFFKEMSMHEVKPDAGVIASVVNASTGLENLVLGCIVHGFVTKSGLELDTFVASSLIDMYSKCGLPEIARNVFSDMPIKNLVAWNSIISCYCRNSLPELSISHFSQLVWHGLYPDSVSITSVLVAVSSIAALLKGKTVHGYLIRHGIPYDLQVESTLIDMYIKCGFLKYAQYIFLNMSLKNSVTWNSMIGGFGSHGQCSKAMELFYEMINAAILPDDVTFLRLLSTCNHCGLVDEGLNLFQLMKVHYRIEPKVEHYVNIVDLLGRAGCLDDAYTFVKNMPIEPDKSIWLSLLSSCRVHRNVELGELAASKLLNMEPKKSSNYVQLLNLYGDAELWDRASHIWASMRKKGLKKSPGCSWIEFRNRINVFFSGDCSSPRTMEIHKALNSLMKNMTPKIGIYESSEVFQDLTSS